MDSLKFISPSETCRCCVYVNKDGSVRSSTVSTEASTFNDSSKRSLPSLSIGGPAGWEAPVVEFALDESLTDCSKLSSDCGSSRIYHDPLNVDTQRNQYVDTDTTSPRRRRDSHTGPAEPLDDSFFVTYEANLDWSIEDDSTTHQDSETDFIPLAGRGRSMIKHERPTRGRSADSTNMRNVASHQNLTCRNTLRFDANSKLRVGNNTSILSQDHRSSKHECLKNSTTQARRRGSSLSRTSLSNELQEQPSRFARSKRKSISSKKSATSCNGSETSKVAPSDPTMLSTAVRRLSSSNRLLHSCSMPVESTQTNAYFQVTKPDEKTGKKLNRCLSSPFEECESDRMYSKKNTQVPTPAARCSSKQKVVHPLTARLLVESRKKEQSSTRMHPKESQDCGRVYKTEALKKPFRHEPESRRRLEKHRSFESPTRKSKSIRHHDVSSADDGPCNEIGDPKQCVCMRPKIVSSQSFPESPSRRQKPLKVSHRILEPSRKGFDNIIDLNRRFNIELQMSPLTQSSREKPKRDGRHDGQIHLAGSENARNVSGCNNFAAQRNDPSRHGVTTIRRDDANAAISNYFTPRHPTPLRNDNPDDSAFWHVDPHAFDCLIDSRDGVSKNECAKESKSSFNHKRFV